jgi:hypothetical protein
VDRSAYTLNMAEYQVECSVHLTFTPRRRPTMSWIPFMVF